MGPFKKYVTCVTVGIFHRILLLNFTLSSPLCYSLKIRNYVMREKKIFCIYGYFNVSRFIKGGRKSHL